MRELVKLQIADSVATIALNDPDRRNALGLAMFDALGSALASVKANDSIRVVLLTGERPAFCAGFDLGAAVNDASLMATFIKRLSALTRTLRRLPQPVVAAASGAAIAGGCALLSACDFVFVGPDSQLGYPVHRLGVSPAVTIPTLAQAIGPGPARALLMSGEIIDGGEAFRLGLATRVAQSEQTMRREAMEFCTGLANKGAHAMRTTKAWLNQIDGSMDDSPFDMVADGSSRATTGSEATSMLGAWWNSAQRRHK